MYTNSANSRPVIAQYYTQINLIERTYTYS